MKTFAQQIDTPDPQLRSKLTNKVVSRYAQTPGVARSRCLAIPIGGLGSAPGYHGCVTHLFKKGDEFLETDVVYGVKEPLIVEFENKPPGKSPMGGMVSTPFYEVKYDFVLQKQAAALAAAE